MKNKSLSQLEAIKSVRKSWDFNPASRVVRDRTKYSRKPKHRSRED